MFQASMRSGRTSATAQATARSWVFSESSRRRAAGRFLEASRPGGGRAGVGGGAGGAAPPRAEERAAADFIDAGDAEKAEPPGLALVAACAASRHAPESTTTATL